jgi:hypothetical protein
LSALPLRRALFDWLQEQHQWPGLQAIAKVTRIRETTDKTSSETAYYLLSQPLAAERFNSVAGFFGMHIRPPHSLPMATSTGHNYLNCSSSRPR